MYVVLYQTWYDSSFVMLALVFFISFVDSNKQMYYYLSRLLGLVLFLLDLFVLFSLAFDTQSVLIIYAQLDTRL